MSLFVLTCFGAFEVDRTRTIAVVVILVGFFLWLLATHLDITFRLVGTSTIIVSKFLRYATSACGVTLIALGMTLLMASFGRAYLKAFLVFGLLVGSLVFFTVFRAHWIWSWHMVEIGETTPLTFAYWAALWGAFYGLIAGTLGAVAYHALKKLTT